MRIRCLVLTACLAICGTPGVAAPPDSDFEVTTAASSPEAFRSDADGYRILSIEVKGRWSKAVPLPVGPGDLWTPSNQSKTLQALRDAYDSGGVLSYLLGQGSMISFFYVDADEEKDDAARTVKLTLHPLRLQLPLTKMGDATLPIPRSPSPSYFPAVPKSLQVLRPEFGVSQDGALGTGFSAAIRSELLSLPDVLAGRSTEGSPHRLQFRLAGSETTENYHAFDTALDYVYRRLGGTIQDLTLSTGYTDSKQPLAGQDFNEESFYGRGGVVLKLSARTRLAWDIGYGSETTGLAGSVPDPDTTTDVQSNRVLIDSQLPGPLGGFLRAALWEDNGWSDGNSGSHQRLVARVGYAGEFLIAPNQTIGVDLLVGGGRLWGDAPTSRRFFGGNPSSQFLYDGMSQRGLRELPAGPVIRSLGQGEASGAAGTNGGDQFWHVNLNFSLPIRSWSFPLIPNEDDVRSKLKTGINVSGRNILVATLKNEGMPAADARAEADRILGEIRPATDYIIDRANLYAVKPLLLFDAAGLSGTGAKSTWTALGGGVQLTVVTARLEMGYMHTLSGPTHGRSGNFFAHLVFQNLF